MTDNQEIQKTENTEIQTGHKKFSLTALISLISGILTYALFLFGKFVHIKFLGAAILAPITAIIAISTGFHAKSQIRKNPGIYEGKKLANTGLWLGWIYIALCILAIVIVMLIGGAIAGEIVSLVIMTAGIILVAHHTPAAQKARFC